MPRFCALVFAALLLALPVPASAQVSAGGSSSGGTRVSPSDTEAGVDESSSGGAAAPAVASLGGDRPIAAVASLSGGEAPPATAAQEPAPEPQGAGEEQPAEPGGQLQRPAGAQVAAGGGELPRSGFESLKLVLLGFVLLLVGARLRVLARARRARLHGQGYFTAPAEAQPRLAPDGLPEAAPHASSFAPPADEYEDPEPQPAGPLPSTATAKRKAGELRHHDEHRGA